ncbi:MAG TPA: hypothetical protein VFQ96_07965 [Microbacteriaceae bacterium]|nr:hypothetical protein [Microbacteriaceae bacterium]
MEIIELQATRYTLTGVACGVVVVGGGDDGVAAGVVGAAATWRA